MFVSQESAGLEVYVSFLSFFIRLGPLLADPVNTALRGQKSLARFVFSANANAQR